MNPRRLRPGRWQPPVAPADQGRGPLTRALVPVDRLATGGDGPEDVVVDAAGRLLTGLADGRVVRIDPTTGERVVLARTGGRPLGLDPCEDGSVLVADHDRGLLRVDAAGGVEVLADVHGGRRITFASNVAHADDGTIWCTTSTSRFDLDHHEGDLLEHSRTGRLLQRDPDGAVRTLVDGLAFANGLVRTPDGSSLLVAETGAYRVSRLRLTGPGAGRLEPWVDNLPGFPDNLSLGSDGLVWVAVAAPRQATLDRLLPLPGIVRTVAWALPPALRPGPADVAWALAFDLDGRVVHDLRSTTAGYRFVTGVAERDGRLYLASLHEREVLVATVGAGADLVATEAAP